VNGRVFGCGRFHKLTNELNDRELTDREEKFLESHRNVCPDCRRHESHSAFALNMLRAAALEPEPSPLFEERIIRKLQVQNVRLSLSYWAPAFAGAAIACFALFAALQMISRPAQLKGVTMPGVESKLTPSHTLPSLNLDHPFRIQ